MALTSQGRDLGAVGLRSLNKFLREGEEDTRIKDSLGKPNASRSLNSVWAVARSVIVLLEDLVA